MQRDLIAGNFLDQQLVNLKTLNVAVKHNEDFLQREGGIIHAALRAPWWAGVGERMRRKREVK